ncbi:unnamed protein product, partial [Urochloa humidicola]
NESGSREFVTFEKKEREFGTDPKKALLCTTQAGTLFAAAGFRPSPPPARRTARELRRRRRGSRACRA